MKVYKILVSTFLIILMFCSCNKNNTGLKISVTLPPTNTSTVKDIEINPTGIPNINNSSTIDSFVYTNKKFSFTLDIPESWKGKYTITEGELGVDFVYNYSSETKKNLIIFTIVKWGTQLEWDKWYITGKDSNAPFKKIGVSRGQVFVLQLGEEYFNGYSENEKKYAEEYDKLSKDIDEITSTFKEIR